VSLKVQHAIGLIFLFCVMGATGQSSAPPLEVRTTTLPRAYLRKPYEFRLEAQGGVPPFKWEISQGSLPQGVVLGHDGLLSGTPTQSGEFRFTVTIHDTGTPPYQRQQQLSLLVVAPLLAEWDEYPKVVGKRMEGSIFVSNNTEDDFDLTAIVLAVNETGRATAIGYQHFNLKKNTERVKIPFGDDLPNGTYQLNVDVVAEVAAKNSIFRDRLVPKEKLEVKVGP
jgi:hypothetical protein